MKESDGEKSDQELVVDVANEETPNNGNSGSPRDINNGLSGTGNGVPILDKPLKKDHSAAHSPHSSVSSNSSTPSSKHKEVSYRFKSFKSFSFFNEILLMFV